MAVAAGGGGGAAPALQLVHGHPVVASFFHTMGAGGANANAEEEQEEEEEEGRAQTAPTGDATTSEDADVSASSPSSAQTRRASAAPPAAKKRRRTKGQKPSYVARREEKEALEREVRELSARARQLRDAMGLTGVADAMGTFAALSEAAGRAREQLAAARSVLSQQARRTSESPLHSFVRLPCEWPARRALMLSMRARKLQEARRFLAARTRHLWPGGDAVRCAESFSEQSSWTTPGGDVCGARLEVTPFRGVGSAQRVVDALLFYFIHLEISLSEQTGNTAVREDDEGSAACPGVLHHRLQIVMPRGVVVEKSSVLFVDRPEGSAAAGELLFVAGDFVDEDERFPYSPRERVRKDISTLIQLSAGDADGDGDGGSGSGDTVVMTKWQFLKLHAARELEGDGRRPLRTEELERLHADHMRGLDAMVATMRQFLYGAS